MTSSILNRVDQVPHKTPQGARPPCSHAAMMLTGRGIAKSVHLKIDHFWFLSLVSHIGQWEREFGVPFSDIVAMLHPPNITVMLINLTVRSQ